MFRVTAAATKRANYSVRENTVPYPRLDHYAISADRRNVLTGSQDLLINRGEAFSGRKGSEVLHERFGRRLCFDESHLSERPSLTRLRF